MSISTIEAIKILKEVRSKLIAIVGDLSGQLPLPMDRYAALISSVRAAQTETTNLARKLETELDEEHKVILSGIKTKLHWHIEHNTVANPNGVLLGLWLRPLLTNEELEAIELLSKKEGEGSVTEFFHQVFVSTGKYAASSGPLGVIRIR